MAGNYPAIAKAVADLFDSMSLDPWDLEEEDMVDHTDNFEAALAEQQALNPEGFPEVIDAVLADPYFDKFIRRKVSQCISAILDV